MLNKKDNINNKITIKATLITTPPVATKGSFLVKNKKSVILPTNKSQIPTFWAKIKLKEVKLNFLKKLEI